MQTYVPIIGAVGLLGLAMVLSGSMPWVAVLVCLCVLAGSVSCLTVPALKDKSDKMMSIIGVCGAVLVFCLPFKTIQGQWREQQRVLEEAKKAQREKDQIAEAVKWARSFLAKGDLQGAVKTLEGVDGHEDSSEESDSGKLLKQSKQALSEEFLKEVSLALTEGEIKGLKSGNPTGKTYFKDSDVNSAFQKLLQARVADILRLREDEKKRMAAEQERERKEQARREAEFAARAKVAEEARIARAKAEEEARNKRLAEEMAKTEEENKQLAQFEGKLHKEAQKAILAKIKEIARKNMLYHFDLAQKNGDLVIRQAELGLDNLYAKMEMDKSSETGKRYADTLDCRDENEVRISKWSYADWGNGGKKLTVRFDFSVGEIRVKDVVAYVYLDDPLRDERYILKIVEIETEQ